MDKCKGHVYLGTLASRLQLLSMLFFLNHFFIFNRNNRFQKSSELKLNREQINCSALMNRYFYPALLQTLKILYSKLHKCVENSRHRRYKQTPHLEKCITLCRASALTAVWKGSLINIGMWDALGSVSGSLYTTYRQEKPLRGTGLEELLPFCSVVPGKGDGVGGGVELWLDLSRPRVQL